MNNDKRWPFIQWFVSDWLGDPKVSLCEPATRGILFDWLCHMHLLDRSGQITGTREQLARAGRCTPVQAAQAIDDLKRTNAADVTERNGVVTITNRRMKREFLSRKSGKERVVRHRCNGDVTSHNQSQNQKPEPDGIKRQFSQTGSTRGPIRAADGSGEEASATPLTKLTMLKKEGLERVAGEIIGNEHGWAYDNCRVQPSHFPVRKSLVTELAQWVGRVSEEQVHGAWLEAVIRTHKADVDGLVRTTIAGYVMVCWREQLRQTAGGHDVPPAGRGEGRAG